MNVTEHVAEVLENCGSRQRYSGVVVGYDLARTTIFVLAENGRQLLAFVDPKHPVKSGDQVSFRVDGMSAKDVLKEIPADS